MNLEKIKINLNNLKNQVKFNLLNLIHLKKDFLVVKKMKQF